LSIDAVDKFQIPFPQAIRNLTTSPHLLVITHMVHYACDSFTAEVAKHAEKASFISLCGLSVLCGEI